MKKYKIDCLQIIDRYGIREIPHPHQQCCFRSHAITARAISFNVIRKQPSTMASTMDKHAYLGLHA